MVTIVKNICLGKEFILLFLGPAQQFYWLPPNSMNYLTLILLGFLPYLAFSHRL